MAEKINFPETKEYGWILQESGKRAFIPTTKSIWNRIRYIAEQRGATIEPRTMGFRVVDTEKLSSEDMKMLSEEAARLQIRPVGGVEKPEDIELDKDGREQPNFGDNDTESI